MTVAGNWTDIPDWPGYAAARDGRIWSLDSNWRGYGARELRREIDRGGYPCVRLTFGSGKRKRFKIHKLMALTFFGPCPAGCDQVRHLDGDRLNNRVENLAWGSAKENADDRERHGRTARGKTHAWAIGTRARSALKLARGEQPA